MNEDKQLQTYKEKWQSVKLSDSARTRIQESLASYTAFHPVREAEVSRSIKQVPQSTFLQRFKMTTMPIAILLAIFVSAGTSFAAQGAVPGDFLYPVKTEVNENFRGAFAFGAHAEADLQADLLEERLEEAQTLHGKGRLTAETAASISSTIDTHVKAATEAAAKSDEQMAQQTNTRIQVALQNFLAINGLDAALASKVSASLNATSLSTGTYAIGAYQEDMNARVNSLRNVVTKYQTELEANVYADLNAKLDISATLVAGAQAEAEADARASLDKAASLIGEVEAKLSTLGQAQVDSNTGIITDIDFSVDPMIIDRGDGNTDPAQSGTNTNTNTNSNTNTNTNADTDINVELNGGVDTEVIDTSINSNLEATSGLGL